MKARIMFVFTAILLLACEKDSGVDCTEKTVDKIASVKVIMVFSGQERYFKLETDSSVLLEAELSPLGDFLSKPDAQFITFLPVKENILTLRYRSLDDNLTILTYTDTLLIENNDIQSLGIICNSDSVYFEFPNKHVIWD